MVLIVLISIQSVCGIFWISSQKRVSLRVGDVTPRSSSILSYCDPSTISEGTPTIIRGGLTNATSHDAIPFQAIDLHFSNSGENSWTYIVSVTTDSNGAFAYTWQDASALASGMYVVMAEFLGNSEYDYWSSLCDLQVVPTPVAFSISVIPASTILVAGSSKAFQVNLATYGGFSGSVSLSITGLPSGVTAQLDPPDMSPSTGSYTSTLSISSTTSAPSGNYILTIKGNSGAMQRSCTLSLEIALSTDSYTPAEENRLPGEGSYLWQNVLYKETLYSVFLYTEEVIREFSIRDKYVDAVPYGQLRIKAETTQGTKWVTIEGVIIVDQASEVLKNDELSRIVLTLAEAQAYYRYIKQKNLKVEDFTSFYQKIQNVVDQIHSNPLYWITALAYNTPPPTEAQLYRELLMGIFENTLTDKVLKTGTSKDEVNRYINIASFIFDQTGEAATIRSFEQATSISSELQSLAEKSDFIAKFDSKMKDLFETLGNYKPYVSVAKAFAKYLIGIAFEKTVSEEYLPYLIALRDYVKMNPKLHLDNDLQGLYNALNYVINDCVGANNIWDEIAFDLLDIGLEAGWDFSSDFYIQAIANWMGNFALEHGWLKTFQIRALFSKISIAVGAGIIIGDIMFDLSSFYHNIELMSKASRLNAIIKETYEKLSSPEISALEANIESRRLQFSLVLKTYEMLVENADGDGLTGTTRELFNTYLHPLVELLVGHQIMSTNEYINNIRNIWIPYYTLLRSNSIPPMHDVANYEPDWSLYPTSSTAAIDYLMYKRRGLQDPGLMVSIDVSNYWLRVDETGNANITIVNPSPVTINDVLVNATADSGVEITPLDFNAGSILSNEKINATFEFSFTDPGLHSLFFWITAENKTYVYSEQVCISTYLYGLNVLMNPESPALGDTVVVAVADSSMTPLANATVNIQTPTGLSVYKTDSSGTTTFTASISGLYSISVVYPNEPTFGPNTFTVTTTTTNTFQTELDDLNSTTIMPDSIYCRGFRIINCGSNELNLDLTLIASDTWVDAWIVPLCTEETSFENITIISDTTAQATLPIGHWTSGYVLFSIDEGTSVGMQTTLTLNISQIGSAVYDEKSFNIEVNCHSLTLSVDVPDVIYHGDPFTVNFTTTDWTGNLVDTDFWIARLDDIDLSSNIIPVSLGTYELVISALEAGEHTLELTPFTANYDNQSLAIQFSVLDRSFDIDFTKTQIGSVVNVHIELTDSLTPRNMSGASVWGILEDLQGNKTVLTFTETTAEHYERSIDLVQYSPETLFNLTILASHDGYTSETYITYLNANAGEFSLSLHAGWNMVSFPVVPNDPSFTSIFSEVGYYQVVTWSGTSYLASTEAEAGRGYWVLVLTDTNLTIAGTVVDSYEVDLPAGWSMIGGVNDVTVAADDVFSGYYQLVTWSGTSYVTATTIEPGKGYWALVLTPTHIEVE
jgi:hypothetical protein